LDSSQIKQVPLVFKDLSKTVMFENLFDAAKFKAEKGGA
jgi:hypothetical protein